MKKIYLPIIIISALSLFGTKTAECQTDERGVRKQLAGKSLFQKPFEPETESLNNSFSRSGPWRAVSMETEMYDENTAEFEKFTNNLYDYDQANSQISRDIYQMWDFQESEYENYMRSNYEYDQRGNILEEISEYYNSWDSVWEYSSKDSNYYTDDISLDYKWVSYAWDGTSEWILQMGSWEKIQYDAQDKFAEGVEYEYNDSIQMWEIIGRNTYEYTGNEISVVLIEEWDGSAFYNTGRVEVQWHDFSSFLWSEVAFQEWDNSTQSYRNNFKEIVMYDSEDRTVENVYQEWDEMNNEWINSFKETKSYDAGGTIEEEFHYLWDDLIQEWELMFYSMQYENHYDNNGNLDYQIIEQLDFMDDWVLFQKRIFNYESYSSVSSVEEVEHPRIKIYPNPASDILMIEGLSGKNINIGVYDMGGAIILNKNTFADERNALDISRLSPGNYIVNITSEKHRLSSVITVQ